MTLLNEETFNLLVTVGKPLLFIIAAVCALLSIPETQLLIFSKQAKSVGPSDARRGRKLPPGPKPWPLVGNLPAVGTLPHQSLAHLAKAYGPLMYLRLGSVPTFVVSSPKMAEQVLKTHDRVFASRPCLMAGEIFGYGSQSFGLMKYGDQWKSMRKLFVTELLPAKRITNTQTVRTEEVRFMLQSLLKESEKGDAAAAGGPSGRSGVQVYQQFFQMTTNVVTRMMFSKRMFGQSAASNFNTSKFQAAVEDVARLLGAFNISDVIPFLKKFDLQGYEKEMWATQKRMDPILQGLVNNRATEIREGRAPKNEDFMDILLTRPLETTGKPMTHDQIKAMLIDVVLAGTDTSAVTLEWAMSELMKNPTVLRRCVEEVDSVVGQERLVNEDDLSNLPLLRAVVKETLRLHPAGALMLPHESIKACEVAGGFFIPAKSRVIVNVWAIGRDPAVWERADDFIPDRFLFHRTDSVGLDITAREFKLLPFGSGRRSCPGMQLAVRLVAHALAVLLHSCHWTLLAPSSTTGRPEDLDMSEKFKLTVARADALILVPTPRLPASVLAPLCCAAN